MTRPQGTGVSRRGVLLAVAGAWSLLRATIARLLHPLVEPFRPRRFAVALVAPVFVLVLMFLASYAGAREGWLLAGGVVGWALLVVWVRLPEDGRDVAHRVGQSVRRRPWLWILAAVPVIALYPARGWVQGQAPGDSWAGLALVAGILLYYLAVGLMIARVSLRLGRGIIRAVAVSALVALWPIMTLVVVNRTDLLGTPPALAVVAVAVLAPLLGVGFLLLIGLLDRTALWDSTAVQRVERLAHGPTRKTVAALGGRPGVPPTNDPFVRESRRRERSRRWAGWCAALAAGCALLAGAMFLVTALRVPLERLSQESSQLARPGGDVYPPAERRLLAYYAPVLRLDPGEGWVAADATTQAEAAGEHDAEDGCPAPETWDAAAAASDEHEDPCLELDIAGTAGATSVAAIAGDRAVFEHGKVYPRIVELRPEARCGESETCRLLDYWLFYPNNRWTADTAIGTIVQEHSGDWEHVVVGLMADRTPRFVGYSSHCTGFWRPWSKAAVVARAGPNVTFGTPDAPASNPLVVVALGSHANYPTTGRREPDWASCKSALGRLKVGLGNLSFAASALETTNQFGPMQLPVVAEPEEAALIHSAPWYWGRTETFHLGNMVLSPDAEHGPPSPAFQGRPWDDPAAEILDDWHCEGGDRACGELEADLAAALGRELTRVRSALFGRWAM